MISSRRSYSLLGGMGGAEEAGLWDFGTEGPVSKAPEVI